MQGDTTTHVRRLSSVGQRRYQIRCSAIRGYNGPEHNIWLDKGVMAATAAWSAECQPRDLPRAAFWRARPELERGGRRKHEPEAALISLQRNNPGDVRVVTERPATSRPESGALLTAAGSLAPGLRHFPDVVPDPAPSRSALRQRAAAVMFGTGSGEK